MSKYILSENQNKMVSKAIRYAKKLVGTPYKLFLFNGKNWPTEDGPPFWIDNSKPPSINYIQKKGTSCTGLINLIRRYMGLKIPGERDFFGCCIGGTYEWFDYLKKKKRLEKIITNKVYPKGTLLIQNYNPKDQGHVAFTINSSKKGLINTKIIHNIHNHKKEVTIEEFKDYSLNKRFTHICLPQNWLLKN